MLNTIEDKILDLRKEMLRHEKGTKGHDKLSAKIEMLEWVEKLIKSNK